ncbi:hypothetical protein D9611_000205 [Ephemerocybe angulata]|uniref:Mitochondrial outer membrane protein OM14 C-terminal domain-containing protein n=1 Tax=Ephemerocybe angulata TaxID=980116 RepID=A0A8H5BLY8_9AGAR|nr:hypothetical protein D9611_000205 [Tulosesus angulatus]
MSYAAVAAQNAPPPSEQPQPDPGLLTVEEPSGSTTIDTSSKINIVSSQEFKDHPHTDAETVPTQPQVVSGNSGSGNKRPLGEDTTRDKIKKRKHQAQEEAATLWAQVVDYVVRPQVAGGLLGVVNVGLIAGVGYSFYAKPHLRANTKAITSTVAAALSLFLGEGLAAEQVLKKTPEGQSALRRAKQQRHWLANYLHEFAARVNPYKGAVGLLNTAVVGGLGYAAYANRNVPWDRRTVSAISAGLLALAGAEGYLLEQQQ